MCILYNNFLRFSFDIPYMASEVVLLFFTSYSLRKTFQMKRLYHTSLFVFIQCWKTLFQSHMILDLYISLYFKFKIYGIFYLWSTSGLKLTISFISRRIKTTITWNFKHIANYCRFILVSKEDRQRIYNSKIRSIRLPKSLEKDTKKYVFCTVIIFQALNVENMTCY